VFRTEDLFLGAFALTRGGELQGVEVREIGSRQMAIFCIDGADMIEVEREYHRGRTVVDLRLLKTEVARLKNLAFETLRRERARVAGDRRREEYRGIGLSGGRDR